MCSFKNYDIKVYASVSVECDEFDVIHFSLIFVYMYIEFDSYESVHLLKT